MTRMTLAEHEFHLLRELIREGAGIHVAGDKAYLVESRLHDIAIANGCRSFEDLYLRARGGGGDGARLRAEILDAITTKETLWFRDRHPWTVLDELLLPRLHRELAAGERGDVRIWSAACSTGQEPYSISITIHEYLDRVRAPESLRARFRVLATDLSGSAIEAARTGRYDSLAMSRGLEEGVRRKHFVERGSASEVDPRIRELVEFRCQNLMQDFTRLGDFDVVFCRNVFIYLSEGVRDGLLGRLSRALRPDGALFLGASEPLVGRTGSLVQTRYGGAIFFRPNPRGGDA